jgi:hypothetical protein
MADFALWATASETAFCRSGDFLHAYRANCRAAIEDVVEADSVAAQVRDIMRERSTWAGTASDLLRFGTDFGGNAPSRRSAEWPKSPRALAGRLRRAQTPLRALGIEIAFGREGRAGTRIVRLRRAHVSTMFSTVSTVSDKARSEAPEPSLQGADP